MFAIFSDYTLLAIVVSAAAALCIPPLRSPSGYFTLSVATAIVMYRSTFLGYVLIVLALFAFAQLVGRLSLNSGKPRIDRWVWSRNAILIVVGIFTAGRMHLLDWLELPVMNIAWKFPSHDMWLLLRTVSFLWELGSNRIGQPNFVPYATWITLPFGLMGPLIRYSEFYPQYSEPAVPRSSSNVLASLPLNRLSLALVQLILGAALQYTGAMLDRADTRWPKLFVVFGTVIWSAYLNSAGMFGLMESFSMLWGIKLPVSYDRPLGQPNISEFWARWNMTVVRACRDYLFYNRWGFKRVNPYVNLLIVFLAVGLWHDINWYWIIWGLMHGSGFCVYLWYRQHRERFTSIREVATPAVRDIASRIATYVFVCLCAYVPIKMALRIER